MPPAVLALILCLPFYIPTRHATELCMSPFATELVRGCSVTHVPVIVFHIIVFPALFGCPNSGSPNGFR